MRYLFLSIIAGCAAETVPEEQSKDCYMESDNGVACPANYNHIVCPTVKQASDLNPANRCVMRTVQDKTYLCCVTPECC